jgi:retinol dehydrogenase 12
VARLLYSKNSKVYVMARSEEKANKAIESIKAAAPQSAGSLVFIPLDYDDLTTVKAAAERFTTAEKRLHVLINNAGLQGAGPIDRTAQGYERHLQTNCLGPFLLYKFLAPILTATAEDPATPPHTVRTVWLSSVAAELFSEKQTGFCLNNLDYRANAKDANYRYGVSKLGNWAYAVELARRDWGGTTSKVIHLSVNPGNLRTNLQRHQSAILKTLTFPLTYPSINGAYTELWAALSPEVTAERSGSYVVPFGRFYPQRPGLEAGAAKPESEGGNDTVRKFWDWSEEQVKRYY